jgi:hypothetical protein
LQRPTPVGMVVRAENEELSDSGSVLEEAMRYRGAVLRTAAVILLASACVGESGPPMSVAGSAGAAVRTHEVTPTRIADLGAFEGDGSEVFGSVRDVIQADGHLFVVDGVGRSVEVFDLNRDHIATLGRDGDGPGEYRSPEIIEVAEDSVLVWDGRSQRISVFEMSVGFVRSMTIQSDQPFDRPIAIEDGYAASRTLFSDQPPENTNGFVLKRDTTLVSVFDETGVVVGDLVRVPGDESLESVTLLEGGRVQTRQGTLPFFRGAHFEAFDGEVMGGPNDRFEIHRWSASGQLLAIDRYPNLDRPVGDADVSAYEAELTRELSDNPGALRQMLDLFRSVELPPWAPAFTALEVSDDDRIWLREFNVAGDESWIVIDGPTGELVGRATFPSRFQLLSVGEGSAVGRWRDEYDVSYVQVHEVGN